MAKNIIKVEVTSIYELEIDDDSEIVQEYESIDELVEELATYEFSGVLPVIGNGVDILDIYVLDSRIIT
jgi:hypothetical protein